MHDGFGFLLLIHSNIQQAYLYLQVIAHSTMNAKVTKHLETMLIECSGNKFSVLFQIKVSWYHLSQEKLQ